MCAELSLRTARRFSINSFVRILFDIRYVWGDICDILAFSANPLCKAISPFLYTSMYDSCSNATFLFSKEYRFVFETKTLRI